MEIQVAGQVLSHIPHPTHASVSTRAKHPLKTLIAPLGQMFSHAPQETQRPRSTVAYCFEAITNPLLYLMITAVFYYSLVSDKNKYAEYIELVRKN